MLKQLSRPSLCLIALALFGAASCSGADDTGSVNRSPDSISEFQFPTGDSTVLTEAPQEYVGLQPFIFIEPSGSCDSVRSSIVAEIESVLSQMRDDTQPLSSVLGWYEITSGSFAVAPLSSDDYAGVGPFLVSAFVNSVVFASAGQASLVTCIGEDSFWTTVESNLSPAALQDLAQMEGVGQPPSGSSKFVGFAVRLTEAWYS